MQLTNVTISEATDDAIVYLNINSADADSDANDKDVVLTRDDLDAGEQTLFDQFLAMAKSKVPA
jgi:hypothetical protein